MALYERLQDGSAVLGVVGLGYVGLPLAVEMAKAGHRVIGFDISTEKVEKVNAGDSYIPDVPSDVARTPRRAGSDVRNHRFRIEPHSATRSRSVCPRRSNEMKEPDTSYMETAAATITPYLHEDMLITLESTTYPGTTEEVIQPILERRGLKVGADLYLAFSPERVDPGNPVYQTKNTPKVVGGVTTDCTRHAVTMYERFIDTVVPVSSTRAAEMTKLLENIFRSVNIALMNELLQLCERMHINLWEVVDAAKTKPFGFMPFYPGPGLGGHCIPIDPFYLSWKAREFDFHTEFIELSGKSERVDALLRGAAAHGCAQHAAQGAGRLARSHARRGVQGRHRRHARVARPSASPSCCSRRTPSWSTTTPGYLRSRSTEREVPSVELTAEEIAAADAVLVVTDHSNVDYHLVVRSAQLILDTRNALKSFDDNKVVRL